MTWLAIWDFDGTLAQRRGETGWSRLLVEVLDLEEPGHPHKREAFREHLRNGFPWHTRLYVDPSVGWRLFDDVLPVLGRMRDAGWTHAILSNHVPELRAIVSALGLDPLVSTLVCSAETGYEKPHPRAFAALLDDVDAGRAVMVGDNVVADVLGAEAVGIPAILVRRPDPRASRFAADLYGLEALLDEAVAA
jgi:putative hydrolase of the HAD superfamily